MTVHRKAIFLVALLTAASLFMGCGGDAAPLATTSTPERRQETTPTAASTATMVPQTATPEPTPQPTFVPAAALPIIDLHFHPEPGWGDLQRLFDQLGVKAAGSGPSGPDSVGVAVAERYPGLILPFAGGHHIRDLVLRHGQRAWNLQSDEVDRYLTQLEAGLRDGSFQGIGEIHVNNWSSNIIGSPQYRFPADSPLVQRLFALSATYKKPLSVHMDAEPGSVEQMERLLASNPQGIFLWAHTGHVAEPPLLRRLLETHSNLYLELSYRVSISPSRTAIPMGQGGRLRESWRQLLEDFPDRFVIGTDLTTPSANVYSAHIAFWRQILEQLTPETAAKLAHLNAERLLGFAP
jgi:hypothetical protein